MFCYEDVVSFPFEIILSASPPLSSIGWGLPPLIFFPIPSATIEWTFLDLIFDFSLIEGMEVAAVFMVPWPRDLLARRWAWVSEPLMVVWRSMFGMSEAIESCCLEGPREFTWVLPIVSKWWFVGLMSIILWLIFLALCLRMGDLPKREPAFDGVSWIAYESIVPSMSIFLYCWMLLWGPPWVILLSESFG